MTSRPLSTIAPAALIAAAAFLLIGGCSSPAQDIAPVPAATGVSLSDLVEKIDAIAQDECATKPAATVFPNCPRFVAEVGNVATAVKGGAPGHPGADVLATTATTVGDTVSAFIRDGCVLSPSQPAPPTTTCGPDLAKIQDGLRAMRTALATSAAG